MVLRGESLGDYLQSCQPMNQTYGAGERAKLQRFLSSHGTEDPWDYSPQEKEHVESMAKGEGDRRSTRLGAKEAAGKRVHWEMDGAVRGGNTGRGVDGGSLPSVRRVARPRIDPIQEEGEKSRPDYGRVEGRGLQPEGYELAEWGNMTPDISRGHRV